MLAEAPIVPDNHLYGLPPSVALLALSYGGLLAC